MNDYLLAAKVTWMTLSVGVLLAVILSFFDPHSVASVSAWLKQGHSDSDRCLLCGMTRSVQLLLDGRFHEAHLLNPLSLVTAVLIMANSGLLLLVVISGLLKRGCVNRREGKWE